MVYINSKDYLSDLKELVGAKEKILVVADVNTYAVNGVGDCVSEALSESGMAFEKFVFDDEHLIPDERAVGSIIIAASEEKIDFIVGIGSGTINDLCRYCAHILGINYAIVATAASMDGYLSTVSPLIVKGVKTTFNAIAAEAVLTEPEILENAPRLMTAAGFGDIIGKYTSLLDWRLSNLLFDEPMVEEAVCMTEKALEICRGELSGAGVMDALVLSGEAMKLVGSSRPASGAEHHIAHLWEMMFLEEGKTPVLHGVKVGVAALVVIKAYEMLLDEDIEDRVRKLIADYLPNYDEVLKGLKAAGCPTSPVEIGISREQFVRGFIYALNLRERFTVLRFLKGYGLIERFAEVLADGIYGN